MYFTSGSDRAFEQLMQTRPGADHFDSGEAGAPEDCGTCRFYRPHWKYQFCVYEHLCQYAKGIDRDMLDEIVDLLVETVCSARKTIRIAGDDYPAELVKSKLMKLNSSHIEFVFDCISKNTTEIRNIKKYLLAVLFNAPSTINGYYTALVAHDMNTGKI